MIFRRALRIAAEKGVEQGVISRFDADRLSEIKPGQLLRVRGFCEGKLPPKAIGDGKLLNAIDWEKRIELLIKLLPLILALLG